MFPVMAVMIIVAAGLVWLLLAHTFKKIGSGAQKLIEPLTKADGEDEVK